MAAMPDLGDEIRRETVDFCFCMDCTGSMRSLMEGARNNINTIVENIRTKYPGASVNLGFVAYRDHGDGDLRIEKLEFTPNIETFQRFVDDLEATGGGDYPEDVNGGLWESAQMDWSAQTRVLVHLFDAPPHGFGIFHDVPGDEYPRMHPDDKLMSDIFQRFKENRIQYYMMVQGDFPLEKMTQKFQEEADLVDFERITDVPEKNIKDVVRVMAVVSEAVCDSIRVSRLSRIRDEDDIRPDEPRRPAPVFAAMANEYKVYCGIDFGTSGSAVAFCTPDDPEARAPRNWADVKTPTHILLGPDKKVVAFGKAALDAWLDLDEKEQEEHFFFREFKMALYKNSIPAEARVGKVDIEATIPDVRGVEVNASIVLREAISFIVGVAMEEMETSYGVEDASEVQWVITVPAIWSQTSQRMMEQAAYRSGIPRGKHDQLLVAVEPECAAVDAQGILGLSRGECYMMIDVGGGTADIACHEMISNTEVREIIGPTGGPWGAACIDRAFERYFAFLVGDEVWHEIEAEPNIKETVMSNFRQAKAINSRDDKRKVDVKVLKSTLKRVFGSIAGVNERFGELRYPDDDAEDCGAFLKRNGMLVVTRRIWLCLFETVLRDLVAHIHHLLDELGDRIQTLCVVGGFAESSILMDRLNAEFSGERRVVRPPNPILSVVRGAAKFGLVPTAIAERVAKGTMGIAIRDKYREGDEALPNFREKREVYGEGAVVEGVFFPFIRKGQAIPTTMSPIVHRFQPNNFERFVLKVYQSDEINPRFVPDVPCGTICCEFPEDFEHNRFDIAVAFDFSQPLIKVKICFGMCEPRNLDVRWDEDV